MFVLAEAVPRLFSPEPTDALGMVAFALLGLTVNGIAARCDCEVASRSTPALSRGIYLRMCLVGLQY